MHRLARAASHGPYAKKKTLHATERDSDRVQLLRWFFARAKTAFDAGRLFFFDESGISLAMARTHAWSTSGHRAHGHVPKNWGDSVTLVAGIGLRGLVAPLVLQGSLTGEAFEAYVRQFVLRDLRAGDIAVFDNLSAHKRPAALKLFADAGIDVVFLPPYSPDLNPIELAWSKVKTFLRSQAARTRDLLDAAVARAFDAISTDDIAAWFRHCGYQVQSDGKPL